MKLVNYVLAHKRHVGLVTKNGVVNFNDVRGHDFVFSTDEVIQYYPVEDLKRFEEEAENPSEEYEYIDDRARFAPAVLHPGKILCVGLNYRKHIEESDEEEPEEPVIFSKFSNAVSGHQAIISYPSVGSELDYEVELVVVIGKEAKNIEKADALDYVFGYTVGNDLSLRDVQFKSGNQWLLGKTADGFGPMGPFLVTRDEIDPSHLDISMRRNGQVVQSSNTSLMIFDVAAIVSYLSRYLTLEPGDVIFTGTPDGVIFGQEDEDKTWLQPGERLDATIEGVGTLTNYIGQKEN